MFNVALTVTAIRNFQNALKSKPQEEKEKENQENLEKSIDKEEE